MKKFKLFFSIVCFLMFANSIQAQYTEIDLQNAINAASPSSTITLNSGTYVLSNQVNVNKDVTLKGNSTLFQVSGTGVRLDISADGAAIEYVQIEKTDKLGEQNIIAIHANNVNIKNNTIWGQYAFGDGDVSRAMVIWAGAYTGLNIEGNTIYNLRQPAYISGTHTGNIISNNTYNTKGWVIEGGNLTFTNNTWGINVFDIAILSTCPGIYYTDIAAMSNANNGAVIEDQRVGPAVLSVVYVDASTNYLSDLGGKYHPYKNIQPAIDRVVNGGKILVAAGTYNEHNITINKSLTLVGDPGDTQPGPGVNAPVLDGQNLWSDCFKLANGVSNVTIKGFEIENYTGGTSPGEGNAIQAWVASTDHIIIADNYMHDLRWNGVLVGNDNALGDHSYWTIARNILSNFGTGSFSYSGYGLELSNTSNGLIEDNIINAGTRKPATGILVTARRSENNMTIQRNEISGAMDYAGILVYASDEDIANPNLNTLNITNNIISATNDAWAAVGILDYGSGTVTNVTVNYNSLIRTGGFAFKNYTALTINASGNWWGDLDPTDNIFGSVDYTPWLNAGTDMNVNPGFQPDLSTLWVSAASPQVGSLGRIQEAVDMVSGSTINVLAGTYVEQVQVDNKNVDIIGAGKATTFINAPASMSISFSTSYDYYCVVSAINDATLNLSGFTIDGLSYGNAHYRFVGVGYRNSGGKVADCEIKNIQDNPFSGAQHGVAVYLYNNDTQSRTFDLTGSTLKDFQKNGTAITTDDALTVNISGNTVIGKGATGVTAQNGIQVWGAQITGDIHKNTVTGIEWIFPGSGTPWVATSILDYWADLDIDSNTVNSGHLGLYNIDGTSDIFDNTFNIVNNGSYAYGIIASDPPNAVPSVFGDELNKTKNVKSIEAATTVVTVTNNLVQFSGGNNADTYGIEADAGYGPDNIDFTATNNTVTGFDVGVGIYKCTSGCDAGVFTNLKVNNNNKIYGNTTYGMESNVDYLITDAKNNWWGHGSGPYDNKTLPNTPNYNNPLGQGNEVTPYIDYNPWLLPVNPYKLYLSSSPTVIDSIIYPNDSWPKPWEPNPDPGNNYPGDGGIDWGFKSGTDFYVVPEVGSFFGASTITVEWDNTKYGYVGVTAGNIYSGGYFNTLLTVNGNLTQLTIDGGLFNVNQTTAGGGYIAIISLNLLQTGYAPVNFNSHTFRYYDGFGGQFPVLFTDKNAKVKSYLGDVASTSPSSQATGDGKVNIDDLNLWTVSYWSGIPGYAPGLLYYKAKYDIGPTSTTTVYGMPVTDYKIQFEDLTIFAMSYGLSNSNLYPKIAPVPETPVEISVGKPIASENQTLVPVYIAGSVQDLRAVSLTLTGSFSKFIAAENGELLSAYTTPVMLFSRSDNSNVYVDMSLAGADVKGISQEGQLIVLRFEGKANVNITSADVRNLVNASMLVKFNSNSKGIPTEFGLSQNYPNPFNPATVISYQVPVQSMVEMSVFNAIGEKVGTLINEVKEAGYYEVTWNAVSMPSGVYFFRINAGEFSAVKKMLLMK